MQDISSVKRYFSVSHTEERSLQVIFPFLSDRDQNSRHQRPTVCGGKTYVFIESIGRKMRFFKFIFTVFIVLSSAVSFAAEIDIHFSPRGGCERAIIHAIDNAREEIRVQAYSFTSSPIAKALLDAHKRGVNTKIILDKSQKKQSYSSYAFFKNQQIPVYVDSAHAIAHNKIIIIDRRIVITGSFNFTKAAEEKNAENLLIIRSAEVAGKYLQNWQKHFDHSE